MADKNDESWEVVAVKVGLVLVVLVISVAGNGTVAALLIRFKKLRTIPNILIANMALVDLLNSIINMPVFISNLILKGHHFLGTKASAFIGTFPFLLFQGLNIYSMLLLALDRYGAIVHGMKYTLWKRRKKAYIAVGLVWTWCVVSTMLTFIPFLMTNIQNGTTIDYGKAQFKSGSSMFVVLQVPLIIAVSGVLSVLTWRGMSRAQKLVPGLQDMSSKILQARQQNEIKAAKTMLMTFIAYVISFLPIIVFAAMTRVGIKLSPAWLKFFARYGPFVASACNPIIYTLRTRRFRHALRQLWKDPCGTTPFHEERKKLRSVPKAHVMKDGGRSIGKTNEDDNQVTAL